MEIPLSPEAGTARAGAADVPTLLDAAKGEAGLEGIVRALDTHGFVQLRGLFDGAKSARIAAGAAALLARPALAGTIGYAKIDHPKRVANPMLIGRDMIDVVLDRRILDAIEAYMGSECVLAEAILKRDEPVGYEYFPIHSDFAAGWRKSATAGVVLSAEHLADPVGVGGVLYLHDTASGAFCYCAGSHKLRSPRGQQLARYPDAERNAILAQRRRLDGKAGDLVLFDDRGFHGPDQPSRAQRTVVLLDYYRVKTFGRAQVSPILAYTCDLAGLDARALAVLGAGASPMVPAEQYVATRFKSNRFHGLCRFIVDRAYLDVHLRQKLKKLLGLRSKASGPQI